MDDIQKLQKLEKNIDDISQMTIQTKTLVENAQIHYDLIEEKIKKAKEKIRIGNEALIEIERLKQEQNQYELKDYIIMILIFYIFVLRIFG